MTTEELLKWAKTFVQNNFLRAYNRRLIYLCSGFSDDPSLFYLVNMTDVNYIASNTIYSAGLIQIKDPISLENFIRFLAIFGIDLQKPGFVKIDDILTYLNKSKWTFNKDDLFTQDRKLFLKNEHGANVPDGKKIRHHLIFKKIVSHFFYELLRIDGFRYKEVFFDNAVEMIRIPYTKLVADLNIEPNTVVQIPLADLELSDFIGSVKRPVSIGLFPGMNGFNSKILNKTGTHDICLWKTEGPCLYIGSFYEDDLVRMTITRNCYHTYF